MAGRRTYSKSEAWGRVAGMTFDSMNAAREALCSYSDDGKNVGCYWKRVPGGEVWCIKYACTFHIDCPAKVRLIGDVVSGVVLEKSLGVEHSVELNEYDRENAALTREQKKSYREAKRYGGTSSDVMKNHQAEELAKPGGKRKADSTGVEGTEPGVEGTLHMT